MKNEIITKLSRSACKIGLTLKKHSPEILIVAGVVGTVASAVMACKATLKVDEVMDESKKKVEKINTAAEKGITEAGKDYNDEDCKKDLMTVRVQTGVKLAKLYAPSIIMGAASITCILASHGIIRSRNAALATAYATASKGFEEYRKRVVERFGEELDRELNFGVKAKEVEEMVIDENGEEKMVKKTVDTVATPLSEGSFIYDKSFGAYEDDFDYNLMFLNAQQKIANDNLRTRGHVFLNDIFDALGKDRTKMGQIVGWVYDPKDGGNGDNYIDFGIRVVHGEGNCKDIILEFNYDGNVLELI